MRRSAIHSGRRGILAVLGSGFALAALLVLSIRVVLAADVGALIKGLDRSEWEIVSEAVSARLPALIAGEAEQDYFKKVMQSSQEVAEIAEALDEGNYEGLGAVSANIAADNLKAMVASRFGEDSRVYKTIELVERNPVLAKELTRAALNANPKAAKEAIGISLESYARKHVAELRKQGKKFWKDMFRSVIPAGDRLAALGVDPVDLYLQGIVSWGKLTAQARLRFNNSTLDCLALRYRTVRRDGGNAYDARLAVENFGTGTGIGSNFDCSAEMDKEDGRADLDAVGDQTGSKSISRRVLDFFRRTGRSTSALAELGLTIGEGVDLIETYEAEGGRKRHGHFSYWLQDRALGNVKARADGLKGAIVAAQNDVARGQLAEANGLIAAIEAEIGKLKRRKPGSQPKGASPRQGDRPVAGDKTQGNGNTGQSATSTGDSGKEPPAPPRITAKCDRLAALAASAERQLKSSSLGDPGRLISDLSSAERDAREESTCGADVFAASARSRGSLQEIVDLRQKISTAIAACNTDAIPALKSEIAGLSLGHFASDKTLLQTVQTARSVFDAGREAYEAGSYTAAKAKLQRSLSAFRELPSGACQAFIDRAEKGVGIIEKIEVHEARVSQALARCDTQKLQSILAAYQGRAHPYYRSAIGRIEAALPKCIENDGIIAEGKFCDAARSKLAAARADFHANRLKKAERKLRKLNSELTPEKTERCGELKGKVKVGLANIARLKSENARLQGAVADCNLKLLDRLKGRYLKKEHPWYDEAALFARDSLHNCRVTQAVDAEAECRREAEVKGKVFGKVSYEEYGGHTCHFCEKGQVPSGNVCVPDEAAAVADCRRTVADQGKVYARTEIQNDGTPICHWCEPGQVFQNGQCGTPAAHDEAGCRRMAAQKKKVYAWTQYLRNGQVKCHWCERGQFYQNGKCHSRVVRTCPNGYVLRGKRCYPRGGGQQGGGGVMYRCTYGNPDGSLLGGGGTTSTIHSPIPIAGANCVRVR
jgi:hypothetical protein